MDPAVLTIMRRSVDGSKTRFTFMRPQRRGGLADTVDVKELLQLAYAESFHKLVGNTAWTG